MLLHCTSGNLKGEFKSCVVVFWFLYKENIYQPKDGEIVIGPFGFLFLCSIKLNAA